MSPHTLLDVARGYLAGGFSVIPLAARGKKPALDWKEYQRRKPTDAELVKWFYRAERNLGIVTGGISGGLTVVDFDTVSGWENWLAEDWSRWLIPTVTTSHGKHVYVKTKIPCGNRRFHDRDVDLRGEGGYVVAPPSVHPDGTTYIWSMANWYRLPEFSSINDLGFQSVAVVSDPTERLSTVDMTPREILSFVLHGTYEGNRDRKAYYAAMRCRESNLPRERAIELVTAGLSRSNPDRDPRKWAEEKVRSAYGN